MAARRRGAGGSASCRGSRGVPWKANSIRPAASRSGKDRATWPAHRHRAPSAGDNPPRYVRVSPTRSLSDSSVRGQGRNPNDGRGSFPLPLGESQGKGVTVGETRADGPGGPSLRSHPLCASKPPCRCGGRGGTQSPALRACITHQVPLPLRGEGEGNRAAGRFRFPPPLGEVQGESVTLGETRADGPEGPSLRFPLPLRIPVPL